MLFSMYGKSWSQSPDRSGLSGIHETYIFQDAVPWMFLVGHTVFPISLVTRRPQQDVVRQCHDAAPSFDPRSLLRRAGGYTMVC